MTRYVVKGGPKYRAVNTGNKTRVIAAPSSKGPQGDRGPAGPGTDEVAGRVIARRPGTKFRKAYADNRRAVLLIEGDSKSAQVGVTALAKRWQEVLRASLRTEFDPLGTGDQGIGVIQCITFVEAASPTSGKAPKATIAGTRNDSGSADWAYIDDGGLGFQSVQLDTATAVVTFPANSFRYARIHFTKRNDGSSGTFVVKSGATTVATINTATGATSTPTEGWTDIDLVSIASRTLTITQTAGHPRVSSICFRTSLTAGVTVIDATHSGARADIYRDRPLNVQAGQSYTPNVLASFLGSNDMSTLTASQFVAALVAHLEHHWAVNPKMGVIFGFAPPRWQDQQSETSTDYPTKWADFRSLLAETLGDDPRVQIWDESNVFIPMIGATPELRDPDTMTDFHDCVHWNDFANSEIATAVYRDCFADRKGAAGPTGPTGPTLYYSGPRDIATLLTATWTLGSAVLSRMGNMVTLNLQIRSASGTGDLALTTAALPVGWRPVLPVGSALMNLAVVKGTAFVATNGTTSILGTAKSSGHCYASLSWATEDAEPSVGSLPGVAL